MNHPCATGQFIFLLMFRLRQRTHHRSFQLATCLYVQAGQAVFLVMLALGGTCLGISFYVRKHDVSLIFHLALLQILERPCSICMFTQFLLTPPSVREILSVLCMICNVKCCRSVHTNLIHLARVTRCNTLEHYVVEQCHTAPF